MEFHVRRRRLHRRRARETPRPGQILRRRHLRRRRQQFAEQPPALVVLALMLPGMDGLEVCRRLRARWPIPVVMLTALGDETDRLVGFETGADDYVTKPFSMNELLARVRANLRRMPKTEEPSEVVDVGDFHIDLATRTVVVAGRDRKLTPKEFDLLLYLSQHPHRVIPHRTLLAAIWGGNSVEQPEYLRVFIGQLRKKIEPDPAEPRYLLTERWVGYRFEPGV